MSARTSVDWRPVESGLPAPLSQQTPINTCADLETPERRLEHEQPDLTPEGPRGHPRLCLLYYPAEEVYKAILLRIDDIEQFRGAKADAVQRLQQTGFDPCRIGTWEARGRPAPRLEDDDRRELPVECQPRVVAGDPGASEWVGYVRDSLARIISLSAPEMGWRPNRALTVVVFTNPDTTVATYQRDLTGSDAQLAYAEHVARGGRSRQSRHGVFGSLIFLNLTRNVERRDGPEQVRGRIDQSLAHEYTHLAQSAISGLGQVPRWFIEGQALYQEERISGFTSTHLAYAARVERQGTALRLADISRPADWAANDLAKGPDAVYSRGYAAVHFLVERHGFPASVQLLRENREGTYERFYELLTRLTGLEPDRFERELRSWLTSAGRVLLRDDFSNLNSGWARQSSDPATRRVGYEGGEYYVTRLSGSGGAPSARRTLALDDFAAEIDGRLMPPTEDTYLYLAFRWQDNGDRYAFHVRPNTGTYRLLRLTGGSWTTLIDWVPAPAIAPGMAPNRLGVRARGAEIVLLVNGQEVGRTRDEAVREGGLAIGVGNLRDRWAEARFDNLVVTNPN